MDGTVLSEHRMKLSTIARAILTRVQIHSAWIVRMLNSKTQENFSKTSEKISDLVILPGGTPFEDRLDSGLSSAGRRFDRGDFCGWSERQIDSICGRDDRPFSWRCLSKTRGMGTASESGSPNFGHARTGSSAGIFAWGRVGGCRLDRGGDANEGVCCGCRTSAVELFGTASQRRRTDNVDSASGRGNDVHDITVLRRASASGAGWHCFGVFGKAVVFVFSGSSGDTTSPNDLLIRLSLPPSFKIAT